MPILEEPAGKSDGRRCSVATLPLGEYRVPDRLLALAIDHLARHGDGKPSRLEATDFRSLDVRHLGTLHENLLERRLEISQGKEDSPKVLLVCDKRRRKTTGSYYTPKAIIQEILEGAVGPALDRKLASFQARFPSAGAADHRDFVAKFFDFRVLDPAMGCGHFLVQAVDFLAERMWDFLRRLPTNPVLLALRQTRQDLASRLEAPRMVEEDTFSDAALLRYHVLSRCIYGVDIDPVAVELARWSLWLHAAVPGVPCSSLESHLRCGNSLIGAAFGEENDAAPLARQWRHRVFDWRTEFPELCAGPDENGKAPHAAGEHGFDAVIGNPPYLSFSGRQGARLPERSYFARHYDCRGWATLHGLFLQRAAQLSRDAIGMIVPDQVGHLPGYQATRETILRTHHLGEVRYWGEDVFDEVVTPSLILIASRRGAGPTKIRTAGGAVETAEIAGGAPWITRRGHERLVQRLLQSGESLGNLVADPGVHTGNCSGKLLLPAGEAHDAAVPVLEGKQVSRYRCSSPSRLLRLDYRAEPGEYFTIRPLERYRAAEFVIRQTAAFPIVGPRRHADYFRNSLLALYSPADGADVRYLVGILNPRLMRFLYQERVAESGQRSFPQVKVRSLRALPIHWPDRRDTSQRSCHDRMVALVGRMLELQNEACSTAGESSPAALAASLAANDRQIDELVYAIYGLTASEIHAVEESSPVS